MDFCKFVHKILMPYDSSVEVHERNTGKAVNIFHGKSTGNKVARDLDG
jgi:hypothetical protein